MFKCIHGIAPMYLCNDVIMHFDIHDYETISSNNMDLFVPRIQKGPYQRSFRYTASDLWNELPTHVKESNDIEAFKQN